MMQSVALTELGLNDDEYVLVDAEEGSDDETSYDYCDDVCSVPSSPSIAPSLSYKGLEGADNNYLGDDDDNNSRHHKATPNLTETDVEVALDVLESLSMSSLDFAGRLPALEPQLTAISATEIPTEPLEAPDSSVVPPLREVSEDYRIPSRTGNSVNRTGGSRLSNKKRRKQKLKLAKKAAAAAAAAAAISQIVPLTPSRSRFHKKKKKQVAPNNMAHAKRSFQSYKDRCSRS